jgi:hypothetical protein
MLGRKTGDISSWERACDLYCGVFGLCGARLAVGSLSCWVRAFLDFTVPRIQAFLEQK